MFKMRDSLPSVRYSPICNVLRQWKTSLIPIYRVYRLYDKVIIIVSDALAIDHQVALVMCTHTHLSFPFGGMLHD